MQMSKATRALLVSCAVIIVCMSLIVGVTYALFTDRVQLVTHLKAGNLNVEMQRSSLTYYVINEEGKLVEQTDKTPIDFSTATSKNVFGLPEGKTLTIVPQSFIQANLQLVNKGNVAFKYKVSITNASELNALSDQVKITVKCGDKEITKSISQIVNAGGVLVSDIAMAGNEEMQNISVRITFVDSKDNNDAKQLETKFDLIIEATQDVSDKK